MPRKARIDALGALHHIIVRGIERRKIFMMILIGIILLTGWTQFKRKPVPRVLPGL